MPSKPFIVKQSGGGAASVVQPAPDPAPAEPVADPSPPAAQAPEAPAMPTDPTPDPASPSEASPATPEPAPAAEPAPAVPAPSAPPSPTNTTPTAYKVVVDHLGIYRRGDTFEDGDLERREVKRLLKAGFIVPVNPPGSAQ